MHVCVFLHVGFTEAASYIFESSFQEIRSSKRKRVTVSETPKLFTSTFKLPKLKSPSSGAK